mgnify:FL=1
MRRRRREERTRSVVAEKNVLSRSHRVNRAGVALCRFRFLLGIVECVQILRMFWYETIDDNFANPSFHFKYYGFEWVPVLNTPYLYVQYVLSALMCLLFASGKARIIGSMTFFLSQTWFFLSDRALYNNHYYLAVLLSVLFLCIDVHRYSTCKEKKFVCHSHVYLFLFQMQIGVVYVVFFLNCSLAQ